MIKHFEVLKKIQGKKVDVLHILKSQNVYFQKPTERCGLRLETRKESVFNESQTTRTRKNNYRAEFSASHNKNLCLLYCEIRNNTCLIRFTVCQKYLKLPS